LEALFAARDALFGPILVTQAGERARQVTEAVAWLGDTFGRRSRPGANRPLGRILRPSPVSGVLSDLSEPLRNTGCEAAL
jgi:hypothetical protein